MTIDNLAYFLQNMYLSHHQSVHESPTYERMFLCIYFTMVIFSVIAKFETCNANRNRSWYITDRDPTPWGEMADEIAQRFPRMLSPAFYNRSIGQPVYEHPLAYN